jgi:peptidoglycan/xylan/chitin deacetylase (PgdA/CDA1 family)
MNFGLVRFGMTAALLLAMAAGNQAGATTCKEPARKLGVSRVVQIDTTGGPRFGHQQYKENDLLADGEIVLTFDDGPSRITTQAVVDALEAQCTKATFFMVGSQAVADPAMVRQIARLGHTVATHTFSHANLRRLNPVEARREVELGFSAVQQAAGQPIAPFFRFPFLADSRAILGYLPARNIAVFSIEADSYDYKTKSAEAVHRDILNQLAVSRKGILLFHDIQQATADALPGLLAALKARGFRVVHLRPTSPVATVPEFDFAAQRLMRQKAKAAAADPAAPRAVTWPMAAPGARQDQATAGRAWPTPQPRPALPGATGPFGAAPAAGTPPPAPLPGTPPGPAGADPATGIVAPAPRSPRPPRDPEPDWRTSIFNR